VHPLNAIAICFPDNNREQLAGDIFTMNSANQNDTASEWPSFSERHWYAISVSLVVVGLVLAAFGASWILTAESINDMKDRVQIVAPFGTIFLALITFCTVAWRGMVTSRQADQQKRQNDANDEVNLAKLLQEGAKMLAETDKHAQILAGIATLDIVVADPQKRLGMQAMDLVTDFIQASFDKENMKPKTDAAMRVLANGESRGIISRNTGHFRRPIDGKLRYWPTIRGFRHITYEGGAVQNTAYQRMAERAANTTLSNVKLVNCEVKSKFNYVNCIFEDCEIDSLHFADLTRHTFRSCDFSSAHIVGTAAYGDDYVPVQLNGYSNYYNEGQPPIEGSLYIDWAGQLQVGRDIDDHILDDDLE
jgi:hypothetical protein